MKGWTYLSTEIPSAESDWTQRRSWRFFIGPIGNIQNGKISCRDGSLQRWCWLMFSRRSDRYFALILLLLRHRLHRFPFQRLQQRGFARLFMSQEHHTHTIVDFGATMVRWVRSIASASLRIFSALTHRINFSNKRWFQQYDNYYWWKKREDPWWYRSSRCSTKMKMHQSSCSI